ncbi:MAG: Gp19/Gp15/Gp42 family protein [Solirubrobacterales bacterium]|nr:Gp19/Gp15/Gp42 family protein [Solirubrobacterales bacterium]
MALIEVSDLDARRIDYEDEDQAEAAIADATAAITSYLTRFSVDLDAMTTNEAAAAKVVAASIVRRLIGNPRGLQQETLGDYSYSLGGPMLGAVRPTPTERRMLREAFGVKGVSAIEMTAPIPAQPSEGDLSEFPSQT